MAEAQPLILSAPSLEEGLHNRIHSTLNGKRKRWLVVALSIFALSAATGLIYEYMKAPKQTFVILMISDGFGPASQTLARNFYTHVYNETYDHQLALDKILVGSSRTRSSSSLVTDSAAGATAFACSIKTYNGAIGMTPVQKPCGTVLEAAKSKGYLTGLVATSRITHATPACFSAHVIDRNMESEIALHQLGNYSLGRNVDLMMGGGGCFFKPRSSAGSCRRDDLDPTGIAFANGWNVMWGKSEFEAQVDQMRLPALALFNNDHMNYEIDRNPEEEPSLTEMSQQALSILKTKSKNKPGFFLMIEGSRIDMAAHNNDPAAHVHDIIEYNKAISAVEEWVRTTPGAVMISVSDHETGGMSVAKQLTEAYPDYKWNPEALARVKKSSEIIAKILVEYTGDFSEFVSSVVFPKYLGISNPSPAEKALISMKGRNFFEIQNFVSKVVSDRSQVGWSTHGHSAVDVNLYSFGFRSHELAGNHENTDIGKFMTSVLKVDLDDITDRLNNGPLEWTASKEKSATLVPSYNPEHYHEGHNL